MNRVGRAGVMLCVGAVMARLLWTGGFGWFVQQRMQIPLAIATVVLLVFGVYEAVAGTRQEEADPTSVRRSVGPVVGWLLVLPLVVLISVAPTGLGAAAADRVEAFNPTEASDAFPPLDTSGGAVEMRVFDFLDRAIWDEANSLDGVPVQLEGLVVNDPEAPDGFLLTRFMVSCCAADGIPLQVLLHNDGQTFEDDTWVITEVVWRQPDTPYQDTPTPWRVEADVVSITVVPDARNDPYESPY